MKLGMFLLSKVSVAIEDSAQIWAHGSAYKFVHTHALKAVPNVTAVEMYEQGLEITRDYVKVL